MGKMRVVLGAIFVCLAAAAAEAQGTRRLGFHGDPAIAWRYPDGNSVGENCFGNCGAGCSNSPNPFCGGPDQYWIQEMIGDPQYAGTTSYSECNQVFGTLLVHTGQVYVAPMRETYHGFTTLGCRMHDNTCEYTIFNPGCWWAPLNTCWIDREEKEWSWTTWREGVIWQTEGIECGCPVQGDYICY